MNQEVMSPRLSGSGALLSDSSGTRVNFPVPNDLGEQEIPRTPRNDNTDESVCELAPNPTGRSESSSALPGTPLPRLIARARDGDSEPEVVQSRSTTPTQVGYGRGVQRFRIHSASPGPGQLQNIPSSDLKGERGDMDRVFGDSFSNDS
eukprot:2191767-Amphidinium_carterae.2